MAAHRLNQRIVVGAVFVPAIHLAFSASTAFALVGVAIPEGSAT